MTKTRKKVKKEYQNAGVAIWKKPWFSMLVVVLASCCDFVTIYSVSEFYLAENILILFAITGSVAFILNFIPALLGNAIKDKETKNRGILISVLIIAFCLLFTITFSLRWESRNIMFQDVAELNLFGGEAGEAEKETTSAENVLTVLIGCSTLFTSLLSFVFSVTALTKEEQTRNLKELRLIELEEKKEYYLAHIRELEEVVAKNANEAREEQAYKEAVKRTTNYAAYFKEIVRLELAAYLCSPESVGIVLQREDPVIY